MSLSSAPRRVAAFTLVELLVVIGIIAVLISILLPALSRARQSGVNVKNLSNLRQMAVGVENYRTNNKGIYPVAAYPTGGPERVRWADAMWPYLKDTEVYLSPAMQEHERERMKKPFAHSVRLAIDAGWASGSYNDGNPTTHPPGTKYFGGYGYNYQYLGNGRHNLTANTPYNRVYLVSGKEIKNSAETIMFADTLGNDLVSNGFPEGAYVVDPPLQSYSLGSQGSRRTLSASTNRDVSNYGYGSGAAGGGNDVDPATTAGDPETRDERSRPAERVLGKVAVVFCDGHGENLTRKQMDDKNGDGIVDNGYWTGRGDPQATFANRDKR